MKTIQITSGRGPRECEWVVAQTLAFFLKEAKEYKIETKIIDQQQGRTSDELQSVTVELKGKNLDQFLCSWSGTIQLIGPSPFRKNHKRKNWFIGFFELKEQELIDFSENEVEFQSMRSSGAGGQHVNKVSSAVRATHISTGIQVVSMDSRSQLQNKKTAVTRLREKINEINEHKRNGEVTDQWLNHLDLERGNAVKVFVGDRFKEQ